MLEHETFWVIFKYCDGLFRAYFFAMLLKTDCYHGSA